MNEPISVRALCEFACRRGDLDRRFTPGPSAEEGIEGHSRLGRSRGAAYVRELALAIEFEGQPIRGRADGYDPDARRLEEFKTHRGDVERIPENRRALHWAQLKIYGAMQCIREDMPRIELALVHYDLDRDRETASRERFEAADLRAFLAQCCEAYAPWAERQRAHVRDRDSALAAIEFPFAAFHAGQRLLAEAGYRAASGGHCLLAQAPTGTGKTIGTLYPALKALAFGKIDRIFYLAAKSTGRALALSALRALTAGGALPLRVLELTAREKACAQPGRECHGESCPRARGFFDRLPAAREAALEHGLLDQRALAAVGEEFKVCPYYLAQEMVRWSDVVVGDYNYYFDHGGLLHALTVESRWNPAVLVDEAHNLVERAREMYSARLSLRASRAASREAPKAVKSALARVSRVLGAFCGEQDREYAVHAAPPDRLLAALRGAVQRLTEFAVDGFDRMGEELRRFYFDAIAFCRLAEDFGEHSLFDASIEGRGPRGNAVICIRNAVPARFLAPRFAEARCAVLFSGTLNPPRFYRDMLGLPAECRWLDVPSPFRSEQLRVRVVRAVSTRWRDRAASIDPICAVIERQYAAVPGNYLVFVSSFDYLDRLHAAFASRLPSIPVWAQTRAMSESDRDRFIERFAPGGRGIGFAVLGGAFAEGIDLPGERLIGAFIATLGMPQVNPINEEMAGRMQALFGAGHRYVYLYPGVRKVVQAAGRVIRSSSDRGTVYLIDDRFAAANVRALLPAWWSVAISA